MISIIICSVSPSLLSQLRYNIKNTIGIDYELLVDDNSSNAYGICHVYNELVKKACYKYLLFIHEDIVFHTANWGLNLINHLKNDLIGLVGISGAISKSAYPSSWTATQPSCYRINAIQHFKGSQVIKTIQINPSNEIISEVVCVDGVFLATRKEIIYKYTFDEKLLTGFHGYDLDFSMSIGQFYKILVVHDILVEHFSDGNPNDLWFKDIQKVHKKWNHLLPKTLSNDIFDSKMTDYISLRSYLFNLLKFKYSKKNVFEAYIKLILKYFYYNKLRFSKTVFRYILFNNKL